VVKMDRSKSLLLIAVLAVLLFSGCTGPATEGGETANPDAEQYISVMPVDDKERNITTIQNASNFLQNHEQLRSMLSSSPASGVSKEVEPEVMERLIQDAKAKYDIHGADFYLEHKNETYYIRLYEEE
jgi:conjugal transfer/entry exclusion protein